MNSTQIPSSDRTDLFQINRSLSNNMHQHYSMAVLKKSSLIMIFFGLGLFVFILGIGEYRISDESLQSIAHKIKPAMFNKLQPLKGRLFSSKFDMLAEIESQITEGNSFSAYDIGVAKFWILKSSATGTLRDHSFFYFLFSIGLTCFGSLLYFIAQLKESQPGIKNDGIFFSSSMSR